MKDLIQTALGVFFLLGIVALIFLSAAAPVLISLKLLGVI